MLSRVKEWLKERLHLEISEEKPKVVNLKRKYSKFLGIKVKATKKRNKYVVKSHMCGKIREKVKNYKPNKGDTKAKR